MTATQPGRRSGTGPPVDLPSIVALADFEAPARQRMDPAAFDYLAGGSWDEVTLGEASEAWRRYRFIPRVLRGVRSVDLRGDFLGHRSTLPIAIAPMAAQALGHPGAEVEMARGAAAAGIPICLSTSASTSLEDVAVGAPAAARFFQLYLVGDLGSSRSLVERAEAAGYAAIVLTVDLPVLGYRDRDRRSGFALPHMPMVDGATAAADRDRYGGLDRQREIGLDWATVDLVRSWTSLPVLLKGILSPADARQAAEAGVDGIGVSTHGARQLDRVLATAEALPPIVEAVEGRCAVWVDGGIRRGLDVIVALALGADAVLIGRPFYWALAAGGAAGVERAAAILREELEIGLTLLGAASVADLDRELVVRP
ncbi:MAG TPA: alpha-hydroxy acid oxidase [Candidatus Limnocylindrales bacterium]|nr:alpha-hydroxy acid oxidase [Candidatus Limnocylindrales bacterium]